MYEERRPAIILDATDDWPARAWTPQVLSRKVGYKPINVSVSSKPRFGYNAARDTAAALGFSISSMPFAEAAKLIEASADGRHMYIMQQAIDPDFPELLPDVRIPEWIESPTAVNFWFGARTITPLHYDNSNNCFVQLYGTKEFVLYSPHDTKYLAPFPLDAGMGHVSQIDADAPDVERFPNVRHAVPCRFTLAAGEMLYMPGFWWHQVRADSCSISMNVWWECDAQHWACSPNSLRPLYSQYEIDRLASIKSDALVPNGLTFAKAAEILLDCDHRWGAAMMAVAAFDELLAERRRRGGLPGHAGCPVARLAADITASCTELAPSGAINEQHLKIARHIASMAHELSLGNEVDVPTDATRWLVDAVQAL
jgi:hypothetical protein